MAKKTVLHDRHVSLGGRVVDFHGWLLPVQYEGVLTEHRACRGAAVVFDTSHMGQFLLTGPDAAVAFGRIGTQNADSLRIGQCRYGFLLDNNAGVIDDTILMRLGESEFLLVVNATTADGDLEWISSHLAGDAAVTNLSAEGWGKIDLQGPLAPAILAPHTKADLTGMNYFTAARTKCLGRSCIISRTGYTGELGYEIMAEGDDLTVIFDALLANENVRPAGLGARDSLRLEMGYPLYGQELSTSGNPLEARMERFTPDDHEYIGLERLKALSAEPLDRSLAAFKSTSRRRANTGDEIIYNDRAVGVVTSGVFSPSLEVSIAMGYIQPDLALPGSELVIRTPRADLEVVVCERPMYKAGTCRKRDL